MLTYGNSSDILMLKGGVDMKIRDKVSSASIAPVAARAKVATVSERLQVIMEKRDIKQADLARMTGISRGAISNYALGRYEPKSEIIRKLAGALNCSYMWLWGYDVPMDEAAYIDENCDNPYTMSVLDSMEKMSIDQQADAARLMANFAENGNSPSQMELTEGERALIELFRLVPEDRQQLVLGMIKAALCTGK